MAGIRLISSSIVQAANPNKSESKAAAQSQSQSQRIDLTPWDLQFLPVEYIQRGFAFYMPELKGFDEHSEPILSLVNNLKTCLSKALDHFPPLAGRLAAVDHDDDDTVSFSIDCNNAGALFVHAAVDDHEPVTVGNIIQPLYVPTSIVDSLFQLNGVKNYQATVQPLLAVQVTKLVDGIFVGISINHTLIDGPPFVHFLYYWMGLTKDYSSISLKLSETLPPPVFQRWFVNSTTQYCPVRIPRSYIQQIDHDENDELAINDPSSSSCNSHLKVRMFHFSKEVVVKLKEKANAEVAHLGKYDNNKKKINGGEISSLQAVLSHFWGSVIRNKKNMEPNEETSFCLMIDARQRLELSQGYFGNAVQFEKVNMKAKELLDINGLGNAAWQMNTTIASYNEEKIRDWLECWTKCPQIKRASKIVGRNNSLVAAGSPRFNPFRMDQSGLGRLVGTRTGPANKVDGKITVFCGVEEGSIDLEVCLPIDTIQALENDQQFIHTLTTIS